MSTWKGTKVSVVSEGGTAVRKGGAGVLVNNLHSQDPPAGPPLEELEDTTLAGLLFLRFFFHQQEGYCAQWGIQLHRRANGLHEAERLDCKSTGPLSVW